MEAQKRGEIDASLDIGKTSRFFWLAWEGAILQAKLQRSTQPIEDFRDVLFRLILVYARPQGRAVSQAARARRKEATG